MNPIVDTLLSNLPVRQRKTTAGWLSFNAVCCHHRGESADTRGRGGVKHSDTGITYHCFNCGFKTGYQQGGPLGIKFRSLLSWIGVAEPVIGSLRIEALRLKDLEQVFERPELPAIVERELPEGANLLAGREAQYPDHVEYLARRGLRSDSYAFLVTDDEHAKLNRRVIVPFMHDQLIAGYTARAVDDNIRPKYYSHTDNTYVFGLDLQRPDHQFAIVCEGPFDALSINGVAVLSNEVNEDQAERIEGLNRRTILVPDNDQAGRKLIEQAIDFGWSVAFPEWPDDVKDINDAVVRYGELLVLRQILDTTADSSTQIKLMQKLRKRV